AERTGQPPNVKMLETADPDFSITLTNGVLHRPAHAIVSDPTKSNYNGLYHEMDHRDLVTTMIRFDMHHRDELDHVGILLYKPDWLHEVGTGIGREPLSLQQIRRAQSMRDSIQASHGVRDVRPGSSLLSELSGNLAALRSDNPLALRLSMKGISLTASK